MITARRDVPMLLLLQLALAALATTMEAAVVLPNLEPDQIRLLGCLFMRSTCEDHLTDLSAADTFFWNVMSRDFPAKKQPNFVKLDLYVESQCPDTTRFIRNQLKKMWALLGFSGRVELTVVPFGKARCVERGNDFECSCQHGPTECAINQLMNCVIDRLGFPSKYVDSLMCMQGTHSLDEALKCVEQLDVEQMRSCAQGERGRRLLALSGQRTASLNPSLDFVPWIVIDGSRNADALYDLTQNVCQAMDPLPDECVKYLAAI